MKISFTWMNYVFDFLKKGGSPVCKLLIVKRLSCIYHKPYCWLLAISHYINVNIPIISSHWVVCNPHPMIIWWYVQSTLNYIISPWKTTIICFFSHHQILVFIRSAIRVRPWPVERWAVFAAPPGHPHCPLQWATWSARGLSKTQFFLMGVWQDVVCLKLSNNMWP